MGLHSPHRRLEELLASFSAPTRTRLTRVDPGNYPGRVGYELGFARPGSTRGSWCGQITCIFD